jgi:hypothetical protein
VFELPGHVIRNGQIARDAKASLARYPIELNRENALWLFDFIVFSPLENSGPPAIETTEAVARQSLGAGPR